MQKINKHFHNVHVQKPKMKAFQLQIIPGEVGVIGQSFTRLTLATQELLTLFFFHS